MTETPQVTRRRHERYSLELTVGFRWKNGNGGHHQGKGVTRDVSTRGVRIVGSPCPPVNAKILFDISLPAEQAAKNRRIVGSGEVCRTQLCDAGSEFAIRCDRDLRFINYPLAMRRTD
jgi:PilZ domain